MLNQKYLSYTEANTAEAYLLISFKSSDKKACIVISYLQGHREFDKAIEMDIRLPTGLCFDNTYRLHSSNVTAVQSTFSFSLTISVVYFFYAEMFRVTRLKRPYLRDLSLLISLAWSHQQVTAKLLP